MKMNIKNFMIEAVGVTEEVKFERLVDPFIIEAISEAENEKMKKVHTKKIRNKSGQITKDLNVDAYADSLLVRCIKSPDLHSAELQAFYKTDGSASDTLKTMLFSGEYANLSKKVLELNGFGETEEEIKDEVKN